MQNFVVTTLGDLGKDFLQIWITMENHEWHDPQFPQQEVSTSSGGWLSYLISSQLYTQEAKWTPDFSTALHNATNRITVLMGLPNLTEN